MKNYWKEFKNIYNFNSIFKYSIIITIFLLTIDYYNLITNHVTTTFSKVILFLFVVFIVFSVLDLNIFNAFKIKVIGDIDAILVNIIFVSVIYMCMSYFIVGGVTYRVFVCAIAIIISSCVVNWRKNKISVISDEDNKNKNYLYSLEDLYHDRIKDSNEIIFINEENIEYDLLERGVFIDNLYNIITQYSPKRKFVISLEGKWGSGKTTVLNIIKKKIKENTKDLIIIDDFDPWSYNDQASLFRGMFDILIRESGLKYSISKTRDIVDNLYDALFNDDNKKKIKALGIYNSDNLKQVNKIKIMINKYLEVNNKRVVFIIDNIDRIERENISLLFKLVNNILDLDYITYVLAFDNHKIKQIMEDDLNIDYDFLKKIIQLQVNMPEINPDIKSDLIGVCTNRLLVLYGEYYDDLSRFNNLNKLLNELIIDIRDFKRFINSILSFYYRSRKYLNIKEVLIIELIKMNNIELYNSIINNKKYYICYDTFFSEDKNSIFNKAKFNGEGKEYFEKLFKDTENEKYLEALADIFPYVRKYQTKQELEYEGNVDYNKSEYIQVTKNKCVCSAKFFDLYFSHTKNEFVKINEVVEEFINVINISNNKSEISIGMKKLLDNIPEHGGMVAIDTFYLYFEEIEKIKYHNLVRILFENIDKIDDTETFLGRNAKSKTVGIISEILLNLEEEDFDNFIDVFKYDFKNIRLLEEIYSFMELNKKVPEDILESRTNKWNGLLIKIASNIFNNNINLYGELYNKNNIWSLYRLSKDLNRDIKEYLNKVLNSKNVFQFVYDATQMSISNYGYHYRINGENLLKLIDIDFLDSLLADREVNNDDERFILELYKNFKEDKKDVMGEPYEITLKKIKKFDLL